MVDVKWLDRKALGCYHPQHNEDRTIGNVSGRLLSGLTRGLTTEICVKGVKSLWIAAAF
jgi:hypothetical protein